jgi:cytochrome P450
VEGLVSPTAPERTRDPAEVVFAWFRTMLTTDPVHRDEHDLWHVFGYADVVRILSDPATFSSDVRELNPRQQDVDLFAKGNFASMDPPRHRKLRGLVSRVFTPRVVAGLAPRIEQITTGLLDEVAGRTEFDLVDTLAYPLPVTVIAELLGVPAADMPQFRRWAEGLFSVQVDASTLPNEDLVAQVAPRRRRPPRRPDHRVLLLAGHVTTTALLGNAVLCLDRFTDAAAQVRADPSLLPAMLEEVLRYRSPFPRMGRLTTRDADVGGRTIPAGRLVVPWIGAANRDPAQFPEPECFDTHRARNNHLSFGHGIHFCIGAPLARLESRIALRLLLERYSHLDVDGTKVEHHNPWVMVAVRRLGVRVAA